MTLHELNTLPPAELKAALLSCCGSETWVNKLLPLFPMDDMVELLEDAEEQWYACSEADWKEAFTHHPKIGDVDSLKKKFASTAHWAAGEQSGVNEASDEIIHALANGNEEYEKKFGYIFIVCATGKSAAEMLGLLELRLKHSPEEEITIAMQEQQKITALRIEKLLQ